MKYSFVILLVFLFLNCSSNQAIKPTQPLQTPDVSKQMRREKVAAALPQLRRGDSSAKLTGENEDILYLESKRLTDYEIIEIMKEGFEDWRLLGCKQIIIIGKDGNRREVDLTALDTK